MNVMSELKYIKFSKMPFKMTEISTVIYSTLFIVLRIFTQTLSHRCSHPHHFRPRHSDKGRRFAGSRIQCHQNNYTGLYREAQLCGTGIDWTSIAPLSTCT